MWWGSSTWLKNGVDDPISTAPYASVERPAVPWPGSGLEGIAWASSALLEGAGE
jgi:hypothetical protein